MRDAQVVDATRLEVAADPPGLDVDDRGRRRARIASAADAADVIDSSRQIGVRDQSGQLGVAEHVVLVERLLDQQQVERVEPGQVTASASV